MSSTISIPAGNKSAFSFLQKGPYSSIRKKQAVFVGESNPKIKITKRESDVLIYDVAVSIFSDTRPDWLVKVSINRKHVLDVQNCKKITIQPLSPDTTEDLKVFALNRYNITTTTYIKMPEVEVINGTVVYLSPRFSRVPGLAKRNIVPLDQEPNAFVGKKVRNWLKDEDSASVYTEET